MDDARAFETPAKMQIALGALAELAADDREAFEDWLTEATATRGRVHYTFVVDAKLDAIAWRAAFSPDALPGGLAGRLEEVLSSDELAKIDVALEQLEPVRVGHWIEARAGAREQGWRVAGTMPFARALALADPNPKVVALSSFAEEHGLEVVHRLGRSAGLGGNRFTEIVARLPGLGEKALDLGLEAFRALKAPRLPEPLVEAMRGAARGPISLSVWLTEHGLSRVGIALAAPSLDEVLRLCRAIDVTRMEPLAAIEGALGVDGPNEVECAVGAGGPAVQLEYQPG